MSGRIRTVKPEWLEDERMALASSDARVLSVGLILEADDYGNGRASIPLLAGRVFPGKLPETLATALAELNGWFVQLYEADGQRYFHLRNWAKHQKVDKPGKPRVPAPKGPVENPRETVAKPPESLAPDHDHDHDHDHDPTNDRDHAAPPPVVVPVANWDEQEVCCPLDLVPKLKALGVHVELAESLKADVVSVVAELEDFQSYWTIGAGQGKRRRHWPAKARERVRQRAQQGLLKAPGAVDHDQRNLRPDELAEVDRVLGNYKPPVQAVAVGARR